MSRPSRASPLPQVLHKSCGSGLAREEAITFTREDESEPILWVSVFQSRRLEVHPFLRHRNPELQHIPGLERDVLRTRCEHARVATRRLARQQFETQGHIARRQVERGTLFLEQSRR